jgi:hypothetical protein
MVTRVILVRYFGENDLESQPVVSILSVSDFLNPLSHLLPTFDDLGNLLDW